MRRGVAPVLIALLTVGIVGSPASPAPGRAHADAPRAIDWRTYGSNLRRSGSTPSESEINPASAHRLRKRWSRHLGGPMIAQPVEAAGVVVHGKRGSLIYEGTEHGDLYALRASSGAVVWHRNFGSV